MTLSRACGIHRPVLVDFIDRGESSPATAGALAHLDRCRRCTEELESTVLAITALRRIGEDARRVEPAADAWPRLRARLESWRPRRFGTLSPAAGAAMSVVAVVLLVASPTLGRPPIGGPAAQVSPAELEAVVAQWRVEAAYIATTGSGSVSVEVATYPSSAGTPRIYPDGIRPERKEVDPPEPSGRPLEAI